MGRCDDVFLGEKEIRRKEKDPEMRLVFEWHSLLLFSFVCLFSPELCKNVFLSQRKLCLKEFALDNKGILARNSGQLVVRCLNSIKKGMEVFKGEGYSGLGEREGVEGRAGRRLCRLV